MNYKSESRFKNQLVNQMRLEGFEVQPIESGSTGRGIPDLYFAKKAQSKTIQGWMELKNITEELQDTINVAFRAGQFQWLNKYASLGVDTYLVISCKEGIFFFKNNEIKESYSYNEFMLQRHIVKMRNITSVL